MDQQTDARERTLTLYARRERNFALLNRQLNPFKSSSQNKPATLQVIWLFVRNFACDRMSVGQVLKAAISKINLNLGRLRSQLNDLWSKPQIRLGWSCLQLVKEACSQPQPTM